MADVFVSYARAQSARVEPIKAKLEALGFKCFFDVQSMDGGASFPDVIDAELRSAKAILACWSPLYFERDWCRIESRAALLRSNLVPVAISTYAIESAPADLCWINRFDLTGWNLDDRHSEWNRAVDRIRDLVRAERPAATIGSRSPEPGNTFRDKDTSPCMVALPAGVFTMGSPDHEVGRVPNEGPQREVWITENLALGKFPVTRGEWGAFVQDSGYEAPPPGRIWTGEKWFDHPDRNWSSPGYSQTDQHPVSCVNWEDGQAYCRWLSDHTGHLYRLPSEAEWEYACRAGSSSPYSFGVHLATAQANCGGAARGSTPVGSYAPNAFGLCDMHGNVWEWVQDRYVRSYEGLSRDGSPVEESSGAWRVYRGGSWNVDARWARSAYRYRDNPLLRANYVGFRVATIV